MHLCLAAARARWLRGCLAAGCNGARTQQGLAVGKVVDRFVVARAKSRDFPQEIGGDFDSFFPGVFLDGWVLERIDAGGVGRERAGRQRGAAAD